MKHTTASRLCAAILAMLMLPLAACSADTPNDTKPDNTVESTTVVTAESDTTPAETDRSEAKDNLPADLKLNGETITILARNASSILNYDVVGTDNTGDLVFDAVWERNERVKERLNADLLIIPSRSTSLNDLKKEMQTVVMSGSGDYDLFITTNNSIIQFGMVAYLRVLNNAPHLDFDAPWWWTESMQNVALDGETIQYLIGDMLPNNILRASAVYVNKDIWQNNFGDPEQIYKLVEDGKWTLDAFAEYSKKVFKDVNGDGKADQGDTVGFYGNEVGTISYLTMGADIFLSERDTNGYVTLKAPSDRSASFTEKLINLFYNENAAMIAKSSDESQMIPAFVENRCLFLPSPLLSATDTRMREMKSDYAIIPIPKYNEEQDNYRTLLSEASTNASIPITVSDKKLISVCAVLEALCSESYRSVTEKFYETALKGKYSRDSASARMMDLILACGRKELATEYAAKLNNIHKIYHYAISEKNMVIASYFEARVGKAQANLDELIAELKKIK